MKKSIAKKVDHPAHYNAGKIEVIDAIESWGLGFHLGNVVKYVARARHKDNYLEDILKANWYLERAINKELKEEKTWGKAFAERKCRDRKARRRT